MEQVSAREVSQMLAQRIEDVAALCLPNGSRDGHEWCVGSIDGEPGQSLRIHLSGTKAGWWIDFSNRDSKGDALDLVCRSMFAGDRKQGYKWALSYLGLARADDTAIRRARKKAQETRRAKEQQAQDDAAKNARRAKGLWLSGQPDITATPAADYLAARGIDMTRLARRPSALRYSAQTWCRERQAKTPAMLACATNDSGEIVSCHRTYLHHRPDWTWAKAPVKEPKLSFGKFFGAAIRLQRGESGKPWNKMPEGDTVAIAEGIEDALTIALLQPTWRVISAISLSNMANIRFPVWTHLVVVADNDTKPDAVKGFDRLMARLSQTEHMVSIARAPAPHKDWNAYLMAEKGLVAA